LKKKKNLDGDQRQEYIEIMNHIHHFFLSLFVFDEGHQRDEG